MKNSSRNRERSLIDKMRIIIGSILFNLSMPIITIIIGIPLLPLVFVSKRGIYFVSILWCRIILLSLKFFCRINIKISGIKNLPNKPCIVASKHESALDTIFLLYYFRSPAFVLKKALIFIPIFGQYLALNKMIFIDRSKARESLKKIIAQSKIVADDQRNIVIFPQGTRSLPNEYLPYKAGIYAIANATKLPVLPIVLNSGKYWGKNKFLKFPGTIQIEFLKVIDDVSNKENFMKDLEKQIESAYKYLT